MKRISLLAAAALAAALASSIGDASAASTVIVPADRTKVVGVAGDAATVVVGNPMFADVSVRQGQVIIHGRNFGYTNVIVLDRDGNQLAHLEVNVVRAGEGNVVLYKAGATFSYACSPNCEYTLHTGDLDDHFKALYEQTDQKMTLSTKASGLSAQ